ncbi:hypothetical protein EJ08DRAFT_585989 [Tothia fuscella]|uniref:Sacsin/Nov domain-containing protein n=1 Tax=Tothia fuscella TaxID=1048955 RepID=A0A9P4NUZ4_9PEZI|nr:hypothetical protein EJ08DRAFT_585989 [Tothia fuscella]
MANRTDLSRLREQAFGQNVAEEAVTVNTRALIDKVLARYSGEWTTLRELIQNAADANAKKVVIRMETSPSKTVPVPKESDASTLLKHTILHHTMHRLVVSNDGEVFRSSDWDRLKRIAEGNPDETKIGAFGVGFYSVFADCEEPFVVSGRQALAFLWKGNSLVTRATHHSSNDAPLDTCFMLDYRSKSTPIPNIMSICQFLATSLTFVGLESIDLYLDDWRVLELTKTSAPGVNTQVPPGINPKTQGGLMKVVGVIHERTQINARWINVIGWTAPTTTEITSSQDDSDNPVPSLRSLFSRIKNGTSGSNAAASRRAAREAEQRQQALISENLGGISQATIFLRISTANIQTYVAPKFAQELERATKKPPPKHTRVAILTSSHDETTASLSTISGVTAEKAADLFSSVLPTKHGRIFIGFPTAQTTGLLCHISAPSVIPTVERESIDLNANYVKEWNAEMLRVAGIICRIAYSGEMEELKNKISVSMKRADRTAVSAADIDAVMTGAVHVSKQYTAVESTPSTLVGQHIEQAFWASCTSSISVLSTKGVLPSNKVRVVSEPLSFLENIPVIPEALSASAQDFIAKLFDRGLVTDMSIQDIRTGLESRSLDDTQLVEFLKWLSAQLPTGQLSQATIQDLLSAAVATISEEGSAEGKVLVLAQIKNFLGGSKIPPGLPIPPETIPFKISKSISRQSLEAFGWKELQILSWLTYLVQAAENSNLSPDYRITESREFAAQVLHVLSKSWEGISQSSKSTIVDELLSTRTIIPTKLGMRKPADSYFPSVKLFDDLPIVTGLDKGVKDKFLSALGVRKTVEMSVVFERLMAPSPASGGSKWNFTDLVQYLVSVRDDIPKQDIERLKSTPICPVEEGSGPNRKAGRLYKITQLYEPNELLRDMGLPLLHWPQARLSGAESRFLRILGLRRYPEVPQLIQIMQQAASRNDSDGYRTALKYFIEQHRENGYEKFAVQNMSNEPFLLTEDKAFPNLSAPSACYWNRKADALGYSILSESLHSHVNKLGVTFDPPIQGCVTRLINNPPRSRHEAVTMFSYMTSRLAEISPQMITTLGNANIVPIEFTRNEKRQFRYIRPVMTFLGDPETYGNILDFANFGTEANPFLLTLGSKNQPDHVELASMIVQNPLQVLNTLGEMRYIELLRKISQNDGQNKLDKSTLSNLKASPCLLAYLERPSDELKSKSLLDDGPFDEYEEEATVREFALKRPSEIVIANSIRELMMFRDLLWVAPQDDLIEKFYLSLGVPTLTSIVEAETRVGSVLRSQEDGAKLRKLIVERTRLFLHEYARSGDIRADASWLDEHLVVTVVDSILLTSRLRGYAVAPHREKRTAIDSKDRASKKIVLYVTKNPDYYEISSAVVKCLLPRPKQHDVLALEMVLGSDLRKLKAKGYNVDRILRQKEYASRLAESERLRQVEEQKQQAIDQREAERKKTDTKQLPQTPPSDRGEDPSTKMPGAFGNDSPDQSQALTQPNKKLPGFLSGFQDTMQSLVEKLGSSEQQISNAESSRKGRRTGTSGPSSHDANPVESEHNITQNLANAIKASRSATSPNIFSKPQTRTVEEAQGSYCDNTPAQDLSIIKDPRLELAFFIANSVPNPNDFLNAQIHGVHAFQSVLLRLAGIYNLSKQSLHIFYDNKGATIAFNQGGALFFNYHYFLSLHLNSFHRGQGAMAADTLDKMTDCYSYWFITLAHELAHNLVEQHSARHSFYAESFSQQYLGTLMKMVYQGVPASSQP